MYERIYGTVSYTNHAPFILSMECIAIRCILLSYMLHHTELLCTWASLHHFLRYLALSELHCPPSCAAFYWATLHPTKLHCTLLSYASNWRATPPKNCTLLRFAAPCWAIAPRHPDLTELWCTLLNYAESSEQCCNFLSHPAPYRAMLYPTELHCTLLSHTVACELRYTLNELHPGIFVQFFWMPECRTVWYRNKGNQDWYQFATEPDWDAGWRKIDARGIILDADAQLCGKHKYKWSRKFYSNIFVPTVFYSELAFQGG